MMRATRHDLSWVNVRTTSSAGVALALGAAAVSGLAIYLNAFAVKQVPDAAVYTTLKNGVAAVALLFAIGALKRGRPLAAIERRRWPAVLAVGVVGGSIPFILFFTGLAQASAPGAAFIQKTLFVWVALLAVPLLGESLGRVSIGAFVVLLAGQALVLPPSGIAWGSGEWLILAATLMWAAETVIVKRLLAEIPPLAMATLRMSVGLVVLVGYVIVSGRLTQVAALTSAQWTWIAITGGVLAVYVATWFAALERAPASVVTSVLVVGAVITGVLSAVSTGRAPAPSVVGGYVLIVGAAIALAGYVLRSHKAARERVTVNA
jgi:drug/metabolite transporter (DMT)-like permease